MTQQPMRVLHVSLWLTPGGGGTQKYLSVIAAATAGSSIACRYAALMPGSAPMEGMDIAHLGDAREPKWLNALRLWRFLAREAAGNDVVHIHGALGWPLVVAGLACGLRHVPYVVSPHGSLYPWFLARRRVKASAFLAVLGRRLLRRSASVVANLPAEARVVTALDRTIPVSVVQPALLPAVAAADPAPQARDGILRIAFVSRVEPLKGLPVLLEALSMLRQQKLAARLDVIGSGAAQDVADLRDRAAQLGVEGALTIHGYLAEADKLRLLRQAQVFCMPSRGEAFSFATAEALAEGVPVVVSADVALAEIVQRHRCGSVVPTDDAAALARALAAYADPQRQQQDSQRARNCARQLFSLDEMRRGLESMYRAAAATR